MQNVNIAKASRIDILRIILIYALFGSLWILFSDRVVESVIDSPELQRATQTLKGWLFVAITSFLLYYLLRRIVGRRDYDPARTRGGIVNWKTWQLYLFAAFITLFTILMRENLSVSFGMRPLLILLMFPIILSAAVGGFWPGLLSTGIATAYAVFFLIPEVGIQQFRHAGDLLPLIFMIVNGLFVSLLSMMLHEARCRVEKQRQQAEIRLAEKERALQLLDSIAEGSTDVIIAQNLRGEVILANRAAAEFTGRSTQELLGKRAADILPPEQAARMEEDDRRVLREDRVITLQEELNTRNGRTSFLTTKGPIHDETGAVTGMFVIARDITEIRAATEALRKLTLAVEQSPESIVIANLDAGIEYVNDAFVRNTGYSREEVIGQNPRMLHSGRTPKETYESLWKTLTEGGTWKGEFYNKRKDGSEYPERAIVSPIRQPDGKVTHYLAIQEDITEKKRAEAEINRLAFYDTLTGLPNRALLLERMTQTLATTRRAGHYSALISYNIDRFKTVNDAAGQELGDALLKAVADRLTHIMREGDVVARIAGDEFGILLTDLAPQQPSAAHFALHVADKLHTALHQPLRIGAEQFTLTACHGIALFPEGEADTPLDILRRANTALHHAKKRGSAQTAFFEGALDESARQRFDIERELHQAIKAGELRVFLQPQVDGAGMVVGAEALVRWQHPQRGLIPPGAFIPVAEESNLIVEIGNWVFAEVCRLLSREEMSDFGMRISVNISPRQFRQADFIDQIRRSISRTGVDPTRLTLEVTEGMLIDNLNDVIAKMVELSAMGIHFSLDDFGTGYSSLSYLKRLPIHEIKIDKTFVQDMTTDPNDASLVETILLVAQQMNLKVVAEGVETEEQAAFLNQRGTVIHQGYLYGRPEPADKVLATMLANSAR